MKTVDVILSEVPIKEENVRYITVTFESFIKQFNVQDIVIFLTLNIILLLLQEKWESHFVEKHTNENNKLLKR